MKYLILADIHSNWPALAAIRETFDVCLFAGDLVDYGTDPNPCIDWVREQARLCVRGNHDHAVAQRVPTVGGNGFRQLAAATRPLHWDVLDGSRMRFLARMPVTRHAVIDETSFFMVHGTPRDPLDEYLTDDHSAWSNRLNGIEADFVLVGHTHVPFHLNLGRTQVVNPGSVGQPRDGDWRCAYAVIENGRVELRRVKYDIDRTLAQMKQSGLDCDALDLAEATLRNGGIQISKEAVNSNL